MKKILSHGLLALVCAVFTATHALAQSTPLNSERTEQFLAVAKHHLSVLREGETTLGFVLVELIDDALFEANASYRTIGTDLDELEKLVRISYQNTARALIWELQARRVTSELSELSEVIAEALEKAQVGYADIGVTPAEVDALIRMRMLEQIARQVKRLQSQAEHARNSGTVAIAIQAELQRLNVSPEVVGTSAEELNGFMKDDILHPARLELELMRQGTPEGAADRRGFIDMVLRVWDKTYADIGTSIEEIERLCAGKC